MSSRFVCSFIEGGRLDEELNYLGRIRAEYHPIAKRAAGAPPLGASPAAVPPASAAVPAVPIVAAVSAGASSKVAPAAANAAPEIPSGNGLGGGFQVIIQTAEKKDANLLTKDGLLEHVRLMEEIANYKVEMFGE